VTAVSVAALGAERSPEAALEALRGALLVPVLGVLLAALVSVFGLRRRAEQPAV
jgi:hypothetical protein